jgi:hypothetical protein
MTTNTGAKSPLYRENQPPHRANRLIAAAALRSLEFGRYRVLPRQRLPRVRVTLFKVNPIGSKDTANVLGRSRNGGPLPEGNRR